MCLLLGHFAKDCFSQPGEKQYSLVPEEEEELASQTVQSEPQKRKKVAKHPSAPPHSEQSIFFFFSSLLIKSPSALVQIISLVFSYWDFSFFPFIKLMFLLYYMISLCHRKRKPRRRRKRKRESERDHRQTAVMMPKGQDTPIHIRKRRKSTRNISTRHTNELWSSGHRVHMSSCRSHLCVCIHLHWP